MQTDDILRGHVCNNIITAGICGVNNFMSWDDEYTVVGVNLLRSCHFTFYKNL